MRVVASAITKGTLTNLAKVLASNVLPAEQKPKTMSLPMNAVSTSMNTEDDDDKRVPHFVVPEKQFKKFSTNQIQ